MTLEYAAELGGVIMVAVILAGLVLDWVRKRKF